MGGLGHPHDLPSSYGLCSLKLYFKALTRDTSSFIQRLSANFQCIYPVMQRKRGFDISWDLDG